MMMEMFGCCCSVFLDSRENRMMGIMEVFRLCLVEFLSEEEIKMRVK